jgi:ABC-type Fe3+/spermidine/putrescine transport system ATPase subunit
MTMWARRARTASSRPGGPNADANGSVQLRNLGKRYGSVVALDNISLDVAPGEFVAILGPSGSGKTTTMRLIGGFVRPSSGSVTISGIDVTALPPNKRDVRTVFQNYALFPHMTVIENVAYGLRMTGMKRAPRRQRAQEVLERVQLGAVAHSLPRALSGGMQQRVALARALVNEPSVLLLDEPLGALDRKLRDEMQGELRDLQRTTGTTFIYVTHDQDEALRLADRVVVMRAGRIEQVGSPQEVYDRPGSLWVAGFVGTSNQIRGKVSAIGPDVEVMADLTKLVVSQPGDFAAGQRVVVTVRPEDVRVAPLGEHAESSNCVRVTVDDVVPLGAVARVLGRTDGGHEIVSLVTGSERSWIGEATGTQVLMTWEPRQLRMFPDAGAAAKAPTSQDESQDAGKSQSLAIQ